MIKVYWETDGYRNNIPIICPCEEEFDICPYYSDKLCHIKDPIEDCSDFHARYFSWEEWEKIQN